MLTQAHHGVPLSVQQSASGSEAALLAGGGGSDASPPAGGQASDAGVAEITRLTAAQRVKMAQIGVPPPCLTLLAKAGVYAKNLADLPWMVLDSMVGEASGMGVAQVTLLRMLHERLQAEDARSGRSSRSESRSSSRTGSKAGSRSGSGRQDVVPRTPACAAAGGGWGAAAASRGSAEQRGGFSGGQPMAGAVPCWWARLGGSTW